MPCINAIGEITEIAKRILLTMVQGSSLDKVAEQTGTPLYRIRMAARELVEAGFAEQKAQSFVTTEAGLAALSKGATTSGGPSSGAEDAFGFKVSAQQKGSE